MLYFGVVGCSVTVLGLVGGALTGRHRASPILQQDTSFEAEPPVDRCVAKKTS